MSAINLTYHVESEKRPDKPYEVQHVNPPKGNQFVVVHLEGIRLFFDTVSHIDRLSVALLAARDMLEPPPPMMPDDDDTGEWIDYHNFDTTGGRIPLKLHEEAGE